MKDRINVILPATTTTQFEVRSIVACSREIPPLEAEANILIKKWNGGHETLLVVMANKVEHD